MKSDQFLTIAKQSSIEIKIKASRFIGETFLADSSEEAMEKLNTVKKREYSATHHCYAYIVGLGNDTAFKYSDDGEPNGTAGKPIYDQLAGREVTNSLVVVTRYYGGTKLGTGGLVRAYSESAQLALDKSGTKEHFLTSKFETVCEFPYYDRWNQTIHQLGATVLDSQFAEKVTLTIEIRQSMADRLKAAFIELTSGKGVWNDA